DIIRPTRVVGKKQNHLRFRTRNGRKAVDAIAFGFGDMKPKIDNAIDPVNLAFVIESNDYYGYPQLQLRIKDISIGDLDI
ncbi:hypothetical protein J7L01_03875, partial [bacterium]|nr:hypothetical protein [bacterium]